MDNLEQTVQRGNEARQILVNPVFVEAQSRMKQKYMDEILKSADADTAKRESAFLKIKVLTEVVSELGIIEQNGVKAEHEVKVRKRRAVE